MYPTPEEWKEAANSNFNEAIELRNISLAKDIIADVIDAGHVELARKMTETLRHIND